MQTYIDPYWSTRFFYKQHLLLLFEIYFHFSSTLSFKNIGTYSKTKELACLHSWDHTINHNENEDKMSNRSHIYDINRPRPMDTNIVNIKSASVWWCLYVLSNTKATFEAQFRKKLSSVEAELKKSVAYKKSL